MRKFAFGLLAATAISTLAFTAASAADLPAREAPPPVVPIVPVFTWTGFYIGGNAGFGWLNNDREPVFLTGPGIPGGLEGGTLQFNNNDDGGFTGGGQIGYNYQFGSFVVGVETDIQWADTGGDFEAVFIPGPGFAGTFVPGVFESNAPEWWGSVRGRLGVAFDRLLVYATGGLAYSDDVTGWTVGGGVEWALPVNFFGGLFGSSAVTFGVEGLFVSFDDFDDGFRGPVGTFTPVGGAPLAVVTPLVNNDDGLDFGVVRAKLNFKF